MPTPKTSPPTATAAKPRSSIAPGLIKLVIGLAIGIGLGAALLPYAADKVLPATESGDPTELCQQHLSEIANSVMLSYNQGQRPDSLDDLRAKIETAGFLCPLAGPEHGTTAEGLATDYIYAPGLGEGDSLLAVLAFELPANHGQQSVHVMPRTLGAPQVLKDVSQIHNQVQVLNEYLSGQRTKPAEAKP